MLYACNVFLFTSSYLLLRITDEKLAADYIKSNLINNVIY